MHTLIVYVNGTTILASSDTTETMNKTSEHSKVREGFLNGEWWGAVPQKNIADFLIESKSIHTYLLPLHSPTPFRSRCFVEERQVINRVFGTRFFTSWGIDHCS